MGTKLPCFTAVRAVWWLIAANQNNKKANHFFIKKKAQLKTVYKKLEKLYNGLILPK